MTTKNNAAKYERHKDVMRRRSALSSLAGREIGLISPVRNVRRRAACKYDLKAFLTTYVKEKFSKPFCRNHLEYIEILRRVILEGGKVSVAMPRGIGKSSITKGAAAWAVLYGHHRLGVIVCATKEEAVDFLDEVKRIIVCSRVAEDFPEIAEPIIRLNGSNRLAAGQTFDGRRTEIIWGTDKIRLPRIESSPASGSTLQVRSITGAIRGRASAGEETETVRPSLVICDDLQKREDASNPKRVEKILKKLRSDIERLVGDGKTGSFVVVGTVIVQRDAMWWLLSPDAYFSYSKIKFKMVEKFPENMDLWLKDYAELRRRSPKEARAFYRTNRDEMDAGAVVDWPESFDRKHEDSRLQRAMNMLIDDAESFYSESQNDPQDEQEALNFVKPEITRSRLNGFERCNVPANADTLTAFIDVHDDILYYAVCAFTDDRTGYVVDYGTLPEQRNEYFLKSNPGNETLADLFPDADKEGRIQTGLTRLIQQIKGETYLSALGYACNISRILIDAGYKRVQVENAIVATESTNANPSKGVDFNARKTPISEYRAKPGEQIGWHWLAAPTRGRQYKTLVLDVNYWKTELFDALRVAPGSVGSLTLWGTKPERHRMIADHVAAEFGKLDEGAGRTVYVFEKFPACDNHFLDCLVGCLAGASIQGIIKPGERPI